MATTQRTRVLVLCTHPNEMGRIRSAFPEKQWEMTEVTDPAKFWSSATGGALDALVISVDVRTVGFIESMMALRNFGASVLSIAVIGDQEDADRNADMAQSMTDSGFSATILRPVHSPTLAGIIDGLVAEAAPAPMSTPLLALQKILLHPDQD